MPRLVEIGPMVLKNKIFFKIVTLFLLFSNYLPFALGVALHLNKFESPLPGNTLCQIWLKLALLVLEKKIFKSCEFIFIISQLSPLWEGLGPSFKQT